MKYNLDIRLASLDELALAYTEATQTIQGYKDLSIEVPERLTGIAKDIKREVTERVRADKERALKAKKARREALKTPDEKRAALDAEIVALEKELE